MNINDWINSRHRKESRPSEPEPAPYVASSRNLIKTVSELSKALSNKQIKALGDSFHSENIADLTEDYHHHVNSGAPSGFSKAVSDPQTHGFLGLYDHTRTQAGIEDAGISPKLVTKTPHGVFMIKPYHSEDKVSGQLPSDLPFSGFNIMAAKNLFEKSGLGHMIEDVGSIPSRPDLGIEFPATIHKFHDREKYGLGSQLGQRGFTAEGDIKTRPEARPSGATDFPPDTLELNYKPNVDLDEMDNPFKIDPLQARQMAAMDFLLGNVDRHRNNWLVSKELDPNTGHRNIVAFDHDRLFNYGKSAASSFIEQLMTRGPSRELKDAHYNEYHPADDHFKDWWTKNKDNIYSEMNRQTSYIKNDGMRRYVRSNFNKRFETIDKWASAERGTPITELEDYIHPDPYAKISQTEMNDILNKLPTDSHQAMGAVLDLMPPQDKTYPADQRLMRGDDWRNMWQNRFKRGQLTEIASALVQNSDPSHAHSLISKMYGDEHKDRMRNSILDDLMANPEYHKDHLRDILNKAGESRLLLSPYRKKRIEELLKGK